MCSQVWVSTEQRGAVQIDQFPGNVLVFSIVRRTWLTTLAKQHWRGLRPLEDPHHVSRITYGVSGLLSCS